MGARRDGVDISVVGVFVVVRKSAFRLVLESVARRALRSETVVGCCVAGVFEEDGREVVSSLVLLAASVDWGWSSKECDDDGRVIDDALGLLSLTSVDGADVRFPCCFAGAEADFRDSVLPRLYVWEASSCSHC